MVLSGHVKNGMIVLDDPVALPEGTSVSVAVAPLAASQKPTAVGSIWSAFAEMTAGIPPSELARLPTNGAEQHDQYLGMQTHDSP
jgi:hypothetical protein